MPCPSCTNSTTITTNCGCAQPTCQPVDCGCKVYISSDCVTPVNADFSCLPIESGLDLTQTLEAIDQGICDKFEEFDSHFDLVNIGTGSDVYKGVNLLGQKEIRKINKTGDLVTVTQNTNDISVSIDEEALTDFIEDLTPTVCVTSDDSSVTITEAGGCFDLSVTPQDVCIVSPKETITIGEVDGCITIDVVLPCIVSEGGTVEIVSDEETACINIEALPTPIEDGITTTVVGAGVASDPYSIEVVNLQKTVSSFPLILASSDDKYTIFINNGASDVVVNVPDSLVANFSCVFIQEGTGEVTIQQSGTATLLYPSTTLQNIIKGQYYWAMVEKKIATNTYYLLGSLLAV